MTNWKLILSYDGTPFHGWQIQPGLHTVQGLLSDAIHRTVGEHILPQGSGRTDAGVHALGQVATVALAAPIPAANLQNALNRCLPPSIRVLSAEIAPPGFHARHSATRKTYEYRIFPLKVPSLEPRISNLEPDLICPPILAPFVWPCPWPLSLDLLNRAAAHVLGAHDFTTFAASDPDLTTRTATESGAPHLASEMWVGSPQTPGICTSGPEPPANIRTITHSAWHAHDNLFLYRVTATGFLHHMVRNLVGTFVQCGANRLDPDSIPTLLAAHNRSVAGPTAPPQGLFLVSVEYPDLEPRTSNFEPHE
jgi:tRNA pseudouridine38-40 synthase